MACEPWHKCVIVNADDFGFSVGVTEGIIRAHREGIVTSTTIAANMPAAEDALARLPEVPRLGIGVHLNASQGRPLSREGQSLANDCGLMRWTTTALVTACGRRPRLLRAVEAEFDAQIRWVLDHGVRPTHLDSHRHAHAFTMIFPLVVKLARRYRIRFIRRHREVLPGAGWPGGPVGQRMTRWILNWLGMVNGWIAPQTMPTYGTWGVAHTGLIDSAWLVHAARSARPGVIEIMTHPGLAGDLDARATRLLASREAELAALCDPHVREAFGRCGTELIHYGQL
jgi:chitin disaccharide deacetylase